MKKLSKRFLTLAIACVMAMAMAVPTFAAAPKRAAYAGVTYTILCTYKHICFFPQIKTRPRVADALIISASAIRSSFLNHT